MYMLCKFLIFIKNNNNILKWMYMNPIKWILKVTQKLTKKTKNIIYIFKV